MTTNSGNDGVTTAHPVWFRNLMALTTMSLVSCGTACAADVPTAPTAPTERVIIRFAPGTPDPQQPEFLALLAAEARVTGIEAIRTMSGDAYVMRVLCTDPRDPQAADPCPSALARLGSMPGIAGIEVDRREQIK